MNGDQQFFQTILGHSSDVLFIVDQNRHLIYMTPNGYKIWGYSPEELLNRDLFDFLHPEDREYMLQRHQNLLESKKSNSTEYRLILKSSEVRYFECMTTPLPDTENYLQVVSSRDITERKRMEHTLEYHKNRHEVLQNSLRNFSQDLSSVMKLADLEERILVELVTILPNSKPSILKASPEKISSCDTNLPIGNQVTDSDRVFIKIGERHRYSHILSLQASAICEKMESIWLETLTHYSIMVFNSLKMIEDLMDQLETASQSKESPQWVLRLMFNLQEQQRLTLSSDLHDTVLQDHIDLYRRLEALLHRYEIDKEVKIELHQIEQGMLDIIHEIRGTCNNLRPPLLRELGLEASLENLFEHIQMTSTYKIIFTSEDLSMLTLSEEQTIGIYRMVQELLHYAEETAKTTIIKFKIFYENERLKIRYCGDAVGFDSTEEESQSYPVRLTSVSQRAQSLGGKLVILSKKENGIIADLELPLTIGRSLV